MPIFSPRRYQPAYLPLHRDKPTVRAFTAFERTVKGALFGCRMCGNCILQETAFVCPMTCPERAAQRAVRRRDRRNSVRRGPSRDPAPGIKIYERAERLGREDRLFEINAPLGWQQASAARPGWTRCASGASGTRGRIPSS
jgi:hypothetical protein